MRSSALLSLLGALTPTLALPAAAQDATTLSPEDGARLFEEEVLPILERSCFECHGGGEKLRGGLWLTRREGLLEGGQEGPSIDLEEPARSVLLRKISYATELDQMPPTGKLEDAELEVLARWVAAGAPWSDAVTIEENAVEESGRHTKGDGLDGWAYQPVADPALPEVSDPDWVRDPLDAFVLARLDAAGLEPAPEADRRTLIRRLTLDLTGLPPTPEAVEAFVADERPEAYDELVERLLASPHYGERWARHWLDVARYADTNGFERDSDKPHIWRYRDWVVDAFNRDLPYDRFVQDQLAGDELRPGDLDALVATGFLRLGQWDDEPPQGPVQARYDVLDDVVRATSEGFLATTLGCARCHDHKGDPVTQREYYSFMAYFEGLTDMSFRGTQTPLQTEAERREHQRALVAHRRDLDRRVLELRGALRAVLAQHETGAAPGPLTDLRYRFYRDTWEELPDLEALKFEDEGELPGGYLSLAPATRPNAYGFAFDGRLVVPESGRYQLRLAADDGARLWLDGQERLAVGAVPRAGGGADFDVEAAQVALGERRAAVTVDLEAGTTALRLHHFQRAGDAHLELLWRRAGADRWRYRFDDPGAGWEAPGHDDGAWSEGPGGFGTHGTPGTRIGTVWDTDEIWLRRTFHWDADTAEDLVLALHHDDDVEVYLNGVPALERTGYVVRYGVHEVREEARRAVRRGPNVIALHCRQDFGGRYVHARPVHRAATRGAHLVDLAQGWLPISAPSSGDALAGDLGQDGSKGVEALLAGLPEGALPEEERDRLRELEGGIARDRRNPPRPERLAYVATSNGPEPPQMHVHVRGSALAQGAPVDPTVPACMGLEPPAIEPRASSPGRRAALATWITREDHPLTARVMVNRVWLHHFGEGIVPSPSDFGELGERASHPELLDHLASGFVAGGWSVKDLHRRLVRSSTYRQSGHAAPAVRAAAATVDPTNRLLWRFRMRRLSAEELRDGLLALGAELNPTLGGPPVYPPVPDEVLATSSKPDEVWGTSPPEDRVRRSIYTKVKRSLLPPLMAAFDFADVDAPCPTRFATTQPQQALSLLNSEEAHGYARALLERAREAHPADVPAQLAAMREWVLLRPPTEAELEGDRALLHELRTEFALGPDAAELQLALLYINLNEFLYVD